jgi:hypothetical protein
MTSLHVDRVLVNRLQIIAWSDVVERAIECSLNYVVTFMMNELMSLREQVAVANV